MNSVELLHFYDRRQTIEAFLKMAKNVYNIKNLRTSKFYGIYSFLWLVFITHNLISKLKSIVLYGTQLETVGVRVLVKNIGSIINETILINVNTIFFIHLPCNAMYKVVCYIHRITR